MSSVNYSLKHKGVRLVDTREAWIIGKNGNKRLNPKYTIIGKIEMSMPNMIVTASDKKKPTYKGNTYDLNVTAKKQIVKHFYDEKGKLFKSITVDNGVEFSDFKGLEKSIYGGKRTSVYYCHPYTSCERGSNERLNREIRRLIPKGTDLSAISDEQIKTVETWINEYPREIFGYATSAELFAEQLQAI